MKTKTNRREFLKKTGTLAAGSFIAGDRLFSSISAHNSQIRSDDILVDPLPLFDVSPVMYMQFMEPLGNTEPSVEGAWNYHIDNWREDFIECVKDLAPDLIRWGGIFNRFYKWREGIGPAEKRPWMYNYQWGGKETNRVGTHEILDFCRRVGAETILGVNFYSDGNESFKHTDLGENRYGTPEEAADWVSYVNDPSDPERRKNGHPEPFNVKYWQLGNESSYAGGEGFNLNEYLKALGDFIPIMKSRDPSIKLIGWGDVPSTPRFNPPEHDQENRPWAVPVLKEYGKDLDFVAYHQMGIYPRRNDTVLKSFDYLKDPAQAWEELLELASIAEFRIKTMKEELGSINSDAALAVTEGHLSLSPYNTNNILRSWLSAAYHVKTMNAYLRHGDRIRICTGADFNGSRWTVNAVMMPQPGGASFLMPIGHLMKWFNREKGTHGISVQNCPKELDIAATIDDNTVYLHVLNTSFTNSLSSNIKIKDKTITGGKVLEMAPEDRMVHIDQTRPRLFEPVEKTWSQKWSFPPASVSIVKLNIT
jgi:alpha-L-arabinofuranosidase